MKIFSAGEPCEQSSRFTPSPPASFVTYFLYLVDWTAFIMAPPCVRSAQELEESHGARDAYCTMAHQMMEGGPKGPQNWGSEASLPL